jgi:hypothetical protein
MHRLGDDNFFCTNMRSLVLHRYEKTIHKRIQKMNQAVSVTSRMEYD